MNLNKGQILDFTLLYVEDDLTIANVMKIYLKTFVKSVIYAKDGNEGLEFYKSCMPDAIVTDIEMPYKNGLEMIKLIRDIDSEIPVVITSAFSDNNNLLASIELGVSGFLIKPINTKLLEQHINRLYMMVAAKRLQKELRDKNIELQEKNEILEDAYEQVRSSKEREFEFHIYKERYHTLQQQRAFKKQQKMITDELSCRFDGDFFFSTHYKPLDILSGDSYGTFELKNGGSFFYIIDAMGKGLSASVTSIQSVSYINHILSLQDDENFKIEFVVEKFLKFIKKQLLDDEMLSAIFVLFLPTSSKIVSVNFSMPPILVEDEQSNIIEIEGQNPPITKNRDSFKTSTNEIKNIKKFMIYSDGVSESKTENDKPYSKYLVDDFLNSYIKSDFVDRFSSKISIFSDDVTLIFISKLPFKKYLKNCTKLKTSIDRMCEELESMLEDDSATMEDSSMRLFKSALFEIGLNAIEHGNLGITLEQKARLIEDGEYDEHLERLLDDKCLRDREIEISYYLQKEESCNLCLFKIKDSGDGFDVANTLKLTKSANYYSFSGRGIKLAENSSNGIFYNSKGNEAIVVKLIECKKCIKI